MTYRILEVCMTSWSRDIFSLFYLLKYKNNIIFIKEDDYTERPLHLAVGGEPSHVSIFEEVKVPGDPFWGEGLDDDEFAWGVRASREGTGWGVCMRGYSGSTWKETQKKGRGVTGGWKMNMTHWKVTFKAHEKINSPFATTAHLKQIKPLGLLFLSTQVKRKEDNTSKKGAEEKGRTP